MSEENTAPESAAQGANTEELQRSISALENKNAELIAELRNIRKTPRVPEGVDLDELLKFKQEYETKQLEAAGNYSEARQKLEEQFRQVTAEKDEKIAKLESRVRELELVAPAVTALSEIVHDPDLVLKTKISPDQIERESDGTVVVVDGYQRVPVAEWAKTLPAWMQKAPRPQGSGAPSATNGTSLPAGMKNPFEADTWNLTEQSRLYRVDRDLYERLKNQAKR